MVIFFDFWTRHDEHHYLDAINEVIEHGVRKSNRTGTDTLSIFGMQMRYSLRGGEYVFENYFWRMVYIDMRKMHMLMIDIP